MKLFYNAKFYSMNKEGEYYQAVLTENGLIKDTFEKVPIIPGAEKIDLNNTFVYPGFVDTHTHCFEGGFYSLSADLKNAVSLEEVFEILRATEPINNKIFASRFDENNIKENRFPTAAELDKIFPDNYVLIRRVDGHSCAVNTKASKEIGKEIHLPKDFNGHLSGTANGRASNWFHRNIPDDAILSAYNNAAEIAAEKGHTAVHTMIGDARSDAKHYELIRNNISSFLVDFVLYPQITNVQRALELGAKRIGGCVLADGSFGSHTAALTSTYSGTKDNFGKLYRSDEEWTKFITDAHTNNLQAAIHCIGDAAILQILKIYETVQHHKPKDLRHELIHCELISDNMIQRITDAKVSAVMQPLFDRLWAGAGGLYEQNLGKERTSKTTRLASMYNSDVLVTGGSDWYITEMDALAGIDAAVRIHNPKERLTPYQAVEIYTKNAAKLSHNENEFGMIATGLQANLVCLEEDIFESRNIKSIQIKNVVKSGKSIYNNLETKK